MKAIAIAAKIRYHSIRNIFVRSWLCTKRLDVLISSPPRENHAQLILVYSVPLGRRGHERRQGRDTDRQHSKSAPSSQSAKAFFPYLEPPGPELRKHKANDNGSQDHGAFYSQHTYEHLLRAWQALPIENIGPGHKLGSDSCRSLLQTAPFL